MKRPRVLVADDDAHIRAGLRKRLLALGYDVVETADGLGVLRELPRLGVDLVILDHEMPNGDGRSIARVIRNESDVPIVFLSGHDCGEFRSVVMQLPAVYYLPKPLDDRKLVSLLRSLLAPTPAALPSA